MNQFNNWIWIGDMNDALNFPALRAARAAAKKQLTRCHQDSTVGMGGTTNTGALMRTTGS